MPIALDQLPDDVDALKSLVADQLARNEQLQADKQAVVQRNEQLTTENQQYKAQVLTLTEQLNLALARRYAASSEKLSPDQIRLFDEAEAETQTAAPAEDETVTVPAHARRKRGRKKLPAALPRVEVIHELPDSERVCPHDGISGFSHSLDPKRSPRVLGFMSCLYCTRSFPGLPPDGNPKPTFIKL
jgi:hypothetical protein